MNKEHRITRIEKIVYLLVCIGSLLIMATLFIEDKSKTFGNVGIGFITVGLSLFLFRKIHLKTEEESQKSES